MEARSVGLDQSQLLKLGATAGARNASKKPTKACVSGVVKGRAGHLQSSQVEKSTGYAMVLREPQGNSETQALL